ncbi:hypothetical protein GZ78_14850 [Endozoicomonas numazuensis]|uniref:Uncharacterized protein n=1 Tax=Endozoicomonas numazuensis TaxID=1137799 RepID=A0A081NFB9_9GAMM|nr:hypothetical protein GZ78_14850 [Endozoicomonas numazuensis]
MTGLSGVNPLKILSTWAVEVVNLVDRFQVELNPELTLVTEKRFDLQSASQCLQVVEACIYTRLVILPAVSPIAVQSRSLPLFQVVQISQLDQKDGFRHCPVPALETGEGVTIRMEQTTGEKGAAAEFNGQ